MLENYRWKAMTRKDTVKMDRIEIGCETGSESCSLADFSVSVLLPGCLYPNKNTQVLLSVTRFLRQRSQRRLRLGR
jgi:hypothetical protein